METFITVDYALVCVPEDFLRQHMNNGVVPRLLGWDMEDGLTTHKPSRNKEGHLTILKQMHISQQPFLQLLKFLRLGHLDPEHQQEVYDTAICLGGLDAVDAHAKRTLAEGSPPLLYNPTSPKEDVREMYCWTIRNMNIDHELRSLAKEGWSVTEPIDNIYVFLRRPVTGK